MDLIERYLYEVGRHLPSKQRKDILSELRSSLEDTLEDRTGGGEPGEEDVIAVIKEMGPPKEVAASYNPNKQYLIGPELYPLFVLVLGIVFFAIIGAQLLAIAVAFFFSPESISLPWDFLRIINSLPPALGFVVVVFAVLQRLDVRPDLEEDEFDPSRLPNVEDEEPVSRGEQAFSIIVGVIVLTWLAYFAARSGFSGVDEVNFVTNPVIVQYLPWIGLSMVIGIVVDIVLLWQGRWKTSNRIAKIAANLFSLIVLGLLIQGHNQWLANVGVVGYLDWLPQLGDFPNLDEQLIGMSIFRFFFVVAFIVTLIETVAQVIRLLRARIRGNRTEALRLEGIR